MTSVSEETTCETHEDLGSEVEETYEILYSSIDETMCAKEEGKYSQRRAGMMICFSR